MAQNNPWDSFLSEQPAHLSVTFHDSEDSYAGRELILNTSQIMYFRPIAGGTRVATRLSGDRFILHDITATPDQLLQLLGQASCPDYTTAVGKGMLPAKPLGADRFIRTTMADDNDNIAPGSAFYFRLDGPEMIRESRTDPGEAVVNFNLQADERFMFGLQESPSQLFELAGRGKPKSLKDLAVQPDRPQV